MLRAYIPARKSMRLKGVKRMVDSSTRRPTAVVAALTIGLLLLGAGGARAAEGDPVPAGTITSAFASVSGDGRYFVDQGAPGLVNGQPETGPEARTSTIYMTDRQTNITTELTPVPAGLRPGNSVHPVISGDGCTAVIVTELALDVFRDDDTGARWDVYRARLPQCGGQIGAWELVSSRTDGSVLARDDAASDQAPAVSRNGTLVAYTHPADQIIEGAGLTTVSLVDLTVPIDAPGRSILVAGAPITSPDNAYTHLGLDQPALSGDGRFVAYRSDADSTAAVPGWGTGPVAGKPATRRIFVWDRAQPDPFAAVSLVSVSAAGVPAVSDASDPVLSREGRVVAFTSSDVSLVPGGVYPPCSTACPTQVYRVDRDVDDNGLYDEPGRTSISLVSAEQGSDPPVAGVASSFAPSLSADGQLVAFVTKAPNLQLIKAAGGGESADGDVLIADAVNAKLRRATVSIDGVRPAVAAHARPQLSDTGRTVVLDTLAAGDLVAGAWPPGRNVVALSTVPSLSLADADLGSTLVGFESDEWYVAVINDGTSSFIPAAVTVSDRRFRLNTTDSTCSLDAPVPPGGNCTVKLTFTPSSPGPVTAKLTVAEAGFQAVSVSSTVRGTGGTPTLRIDEAGHDFGSVEVGSSSKELAFDVRNISLLPTSIRTVNVDGANAADFVVTENNCAFRPLNPRATCTVGMTFRPSAAGRRTAVVSFATPSGEYTTIVVGGDGAYAPTLQFASREVPAGGNMVLIGNGYPPSTPLTVLFGDGADPPVTVQSTSAGDLLANVAVGSNARPGRRTLVVQGPAGVVASAPITILPDDQAMVGLPGFGLAD
jgi:hypothetical protein